MPFLTPPPRGIPYKLASYQCLNSNMFFEGITQVTSGSANKAEIFQRPPCTIEGDLDWNISFFALRHEIPTEEKKKVCG